MKKILLAFIILLTLLHQESRSQSITISSPNYYQCSGNKFKVIFRAEGIDANNKLQLEISVNRANSYFKVNTQRNGDTLTAVIPPNINEVFPTGISSGYQVRATSTSPVFTSQPQVIVVLDKMKLKFSGQIVANLYENVQLTPIAFGTLPYTVTFSNGQEVTADRNIPLNVPPNKEAVYTPVSVTNTCGAGEVSGSQSVTVQPIGLRISTTDLPGAYCAGGVFYVYIIKSAPFNKDNQFTVQQKDQFTNTYNDWETTMVNDTLLKVRIPDNTPEQGFDYLRVVSSSPYVTSRDFQVQGIIKKRSVNLISPDRDEKSRPTFSMQGSTVGGSSVTLSNGMTYSSLEGVYEYDYLLPDNESRTYTITKAEDACGVIPPANIAGSFTLNKIPAESIFINLQAYWLAICRGVRNPITIPVFFGQPVEDNGHFKVEFSVYESGEEVLVEVLPAQLSADKKSIIVNFPNELYNKYETSSAFWGFYGRIVNENLNIISRSLSINFNSLPKASFCCNARITIPGRKFVELTPNVEGGGPYKIELSDGTIGTINVMDETIGVYPTKTTEYTIKSVTNACGTETSNSGKLTVEVSTPTDFNIQMSKPEINKICVGNSMPFSFEITGTAPTNTKYKIELVNNSTSSGVPVILGTGTASPIIVNFPTDLSFYGREGDVNFDTKSIRITTEDGKVVSNAYPFYIRHTPKASITFSEGAPTFTFRNTVNVGLTGGEPFYYSINNGPEVFFVSSTYSPKYGGSDSFLKVFQQPGEYSVTSVRNECGTGEMIGNKVKVLPFALLLNKETPKFNGCIDGAYPISYIVRGINEAGTLKAALSDGNGVIKELEIVKQGNPVWVKFPSDLPGYRYYLNLIEQNYGIESNKIEVELYNIPTGKITTKGGGSLAYIEPSYDSYNCIQLTANIDCDAWVENAPAGWSYRGGDNCFIVKPKEQSTTYTLKKLINMCGYVDTESSVRVDYAPFIKILSTEYSYCSSISLPFQFEAKGVYPATNEFVITLKDGARSWELRRQKELNFSGGLKLPTNLPLTTPTFYYIEVRSTAFSNITQTLYFNLASKPSAEIIDGSTTVNPGDMTKIPLILSGINGKATLNFTNGNTYDIGDNYTSMFVNYTKTTVLELKSVTNACGTEPAKGKFTVNVNPASLKTITSTLITEKVCKGSKIQVIPVVKGVTATLKYRVQLSDEKGENFKDIPTETIPNSTSLYAIIPENIVEGVNYRLRVVTPDDSEVQSSATTNPITIKDNFIVNVSLPKSFYTDNSLAQIKFELSGKSPWNIVYGDSTEKYRKAIRVESSPYTLLLGPVNSNTYFKVLWVNNIDCDAGIIKGTNPFRIELLTAVENESTPILVYPNPTESSLKIESKIAIEKVLITDLSGKLIKSISKDLEQGIIDISDLPSTLFILEVFTKSKSYKYKIVKL
jgi:hypothetical protein